MHTEGQVAGHYARGGGLEAAILRALADAGKDAERLAPEDLAPLEEFHTGGRQATIDLAAVVTPLSFGRAPTVRGAVCFWPGAAVQPCLAG